MLIDFSISNFHSIREMQTISFEATNDNHLEDYFVVKVGKYRLLKMATILGANASGKSNVLKALYMLPQLMLSPCQDKTSAIAYDKFALDTECQKRHSEIVANFIVGDAKYMYAVEFDNKIVYREILKCLPFDALREHTVYERTTDEAKLVSKMKWGEKYRSVINTRILSGNLLHNRTLFGAYLNSNVDIPWMKAILDWIEAYFIPMVTTGDQRLKNYVSQSVMNNRINRQDLIRQIMKADVGISDVEVEQKRVDDEHVLLDVHMSHNGHQGTVAFDYEQESGGTQRYYELSGLLLEVIKDSHFLAIDELECRLHPDLYQHFITTYIRNSKNSQIIFSSHMREFLADRDSFRDDSVWIAEKSDIGDTEIYSLADFDTDTLRGVTSRYNAYRAGKLGGVPRLGDTYVASSRTDEP